MVLGVVGVGCFFDLLVDLLALDFARDLVVVDFDADLVATCFVVLRGARAVVVLRVEEVAFGVRFTVFFAVVGLLLLAGVALRDDVRRDVVTALDLVADDFDGVDFFRADGLFVVLDVVVFCFVVAAFLVAIFSLPAK